MRNCVIYLLCFVCPIVMKLIGFFFHFSFDKMTRKRTVFLSFVSSFFIVALLFYFLSYLNLQSTIKVKEIKLPVKRRNNGQKVILFYNRFDSSQGDKKRNKGSGHRLPLSDNCPFVNCILTTEKSYLKDITHFDAIVFNRFYYPIEPPEQRSPHQIYIMMTKEWASFQVSKHWVEIQENIY